MPHTRSPGPASSRAVNGDTTIFLSLRTSAEIKFAALRIATSFRKVSSKSNCARPFAPGPLGKYELKAPIVPAAAPLQV